MKLTLLVSFACAMTCAVPAAASAPTAVYVFGDSLVDAGNILIATGGTIPDPAQGYFQGRFNEGYDFSDYLSIRFTGLPTFPSLIGGTNYAWGGARAIGPAYGGVPVPGAKGQLDAYVAASGNVGDPNGLYIINFGGNDVFGINSGDIGLLTPIDAGLLAIDNIKNIVTTLDSIGAGNILVMGIPNGDATGTALNMGLQAALDGIEPGLSANLFRFSYTDFYGRVATDPGSYGYPPVVDFTTPCRAARPVINGKINCSGYFGFDGIHFANQAHIGIGRDLVLALGVPEPASWALMIAGFGMVGGALRRRQFATA